MSSRYSPRWSKQDRESVEPLLRHLHQQGMSRTDMAAEISLRYGRPITTSQIDTMREQMSLRTYKKTPSDHLKHGRFSFESSDDSLLHDQGLNPSESNMILDLELEMMEIERAVDKDECVLDMAREASYATQAVPELDQGSMSTSSEVAITIDTAIVQLQDDSTGGASLKTDAIPESDENAVDGHTHPSSRRVMSAQKEAQMDLANYDLTEDTATMTCKHMLTQAVEFCLRIQQDGKYCEENIFRLQYAAMILHTLKEFELAFDLYFALFHHFCKIHLQLHEDAEETSHVALKLTVAAINCVRSARTTAHAQISVIILNEIRDRVSVALEESFVEEYMQILKEQISQAGIFTRLSELDSPKLAVKYMEMSRPSVFKGAEVVGRYYVPRTFVPDLSLIHLYECPTTKASICKALEMAIDFLEWRSVLVDGLLNDHWNSVRDDTCVARTLACVLLEDQTVQAAFPIRYESFQSTQSQDHGDFPCQLNGQAMIGIVFALLKWTRKQVFHDRATYPSSYYKFAATYLRSKITSNYTEYCEFLDIFLVEMAHPDVSQSIDGSLVSQERLLGVAVDLVNLAATIPVPTATPGIDAQNPQYTTDQSREGNTTPSRPARPPSPAQTVYRSSTGSSDWQLFCATADRARLSVATSILTGYTVSSGGGSSNSSDRFSRVTGMSYMPSIIESVRNSIASDITMTW